MIDADRYNPYPSFQLGQKEAITQIQSLYESGIKVIELDAPTASGKSLDLYVLGLILSKEYDLDKTIYTTPLVALTTQLEKNKYFNKMPVLKGKKNYQCARFSDLMADDCPFGSWSSAIKSCKGDDSASRGLPCCDCIYQLARKAFTDAPFGATTFARYVVDPGCHETCKALLIDESAGLENALVNFATLKLPDDTDIKNLRSSVVDYSYKLSQRASRLEEELKDLWSELNATAYKRVVMENIAQVSREKKKCEREQAKCAKVLYHIDEGHHYIVDKEKKFRLLEGKSEFKRLIRGLDLVVLASGTPTTSLYAENYEIVKIQHPIPLSQRLVYYCPIGSMNFKDRDATAPNIAAAIEKLHSKYHKKTMVHCSGYGIAKLIYSNLSEKSKKITILQDNPDDRELYKNAFMLSENECIFLSIKFVEGLDLKGPNFPMNIIAKIPFEPIKDEFVAHRNEHDNYLRYNTFTAVDVMQAAGRCTRTPTDFSETWILDASWKSFFARNRKKFEPWFIAALQEGVL